MLAGVAVSDLELLRGAPRMKSSRQEVDTRLQPMLRAIERRRGETAAANGTPCTFVNGLSTRCFVKVRRRAAR